jgi:branched-chain amino acid transport system ATP-binding protein
MLSVRGLNAWYRLSHIVQGADLDLAAGEVVAVLGRNGAGKTTLLRTIMGLLAKRTGQVTFAGTEIGPLPTHARYHLGLAYVPEDRRIVPGLSVRENLRLGMIASRTRISESAAIEEVAATFPRLAQRLDQEAITMSGGEQQMLSIARALVARPRAVLLDEPSEGIMPVLIDEMYALFASLKAQGVALLLVEQDVERALELADRAYVIDNGQVVYSNDAAVMRADPDIQERYCSV